MNARGHLLWVRVAFLLIIAATAAAARSVKRTDSTTSSPIQRRDAARTRMIALVRAMNANVPLTLQFVRAYFGISRELRDAQLKCTSDGAQKLAAARQHERRCYIMAT